MTRTHTHAFERIFFFFFFGPREDFLNPYLWNIYFFFLYSCETLEVHFICAKDVFAEFRAKYLVSF